MASDSLQPPDFCILPFIHFHAGSHGKVRFCCEAQGVLGDLNKAGIATIWNNEAFKDARRRLLNGEKLPQCKACYQAEASGDKSLRQESNSRFASALKEVLRQNKVNQPAPVSWDIRFSNLCNLRCRTCWHGNSAAWYSEGRKLNALAGRRPLIYALSNEAAFWEELSPLLDHTCDWFLAGGEPWLMKEHLQLLDMLYQQNLTHVHLRYHTSLMLPRRKLQEVLNRIQPFEQITIGASIDHWSAKGEYIRKGSRWPQIQENLKCIKSRLPQAVIEWVPTVSIFNILDFPQLYHYFMSKGFFKTGNLRANILKMPTFFNVRILPESTKTALKQKIAKYRDAGYITHPSDQKEFQRICEYMTGASWTDKIKKFFTYNQKLDDFRNEAFHEVFPKLHAELMQGNG